MSLPKISQSAFFSLFRTYAISLGFILLVFILTNAFSSLDLIAAHRLPPADMLMTFGFIIFSGLVEAALFAILISLLLLFIQRTFHRDVSPLFRRLIILGFALSWINLLLTIFNRPLF